MRNFPDFKVSVLLLLSAACFWGLFSPAPTKAVGIRFDMAVTHETAEDAASGDIVSLNQEGLLIRTQVENDTRMFGVVNLNPTLVIRGKSGLPVSRSGQITVNITTLGGPVIPGDYITSSLIPGKGQKASQLSGYMLGVALEPFAETDGVETDFEGKKIREGTLRVEVGIGPASPVLIKAQGGIFGTFKQLLANALYNLSVSQKLDRVIRYFIAALVALTVVFVNFFTFGKNISRGIEAIGRNPLAKYAIQSMIIVNVLMIVVVTIGGVFVSLAILTV